VEGKVEKNSLHPLELFLPSITSLVDGFFESAMPILPRANHRQLEKGIHKLGCN
jgi:hypothetical protein